MSESKVAKLKRESKHYHARVEILEHIESTGCPDGSQIKWLMGFVIRNTLQTVLALKSHYTKLAEETHKELMEVLKDAATIVPEPVVLHPNCVCDRPGFPGGKVHRTDRS